MRAAAPTKSRLDGAAFCFSAPSGCARGPGRFLRKLFLLGEVGRVGYRLRTTTERSQSLKPNYQYEKRQRELEKKKKKAEKELKKAASAGAPPATEDAAVPPENK
ncbi:hypothetical protein [uncultured Thiobacillus sp.]|uniref:hypothetical protein n=1 Tax=uncultured Thiobacillus sp. TaxID=189996 RepID=UPI002633BB42|nr:hypothetical protein [uncultured Thiobacillus sp.]